MNEKGRIVRKFFSWIVFVALPCLVSTLGTDHVQAGTACTCNGTDVPDRFTASTVETWSWWSDLNDLVDCCNRDSGGRARIWGSTTIGAGSINCNQNEVPPGFVAVGFSIVLDISDERWGITHQQPGNCSPQPEDNCDSPWLTCDEYDWGLVTGQVLFPCSGTGDAYLIVQFTDELIGTYFGPSNCSVPYAAAGGPLFPGPHSIFRLWDDALTPSPMGVHVAPATDFSVTFTFNESESHEDSSMRVNAQFSMRAGGDFPDEPWDNGDCGLGNDGAGCGGSRDGAADAGAGDSGGFGLQPPPCAGNGTSVYPVLLRNSVKRETETDLVVPLRGQDYRLTRSYNSDPRRSPDGRLVKDWVGSNWDLSGMLYLANKEAWTCPDTPDAMGLMPERLDLVVPGTARVPFFPEDETPEAADPGTGFGSDFRGTRYYSGGSRYRFMDVVKDPTTDEYHPRLAETGSREWVFRNTDGASAYMPRTVQIERDLYGNEWHYEWSEQVYETGDHSLTFTDTGTGSYDCTSDGGLIMQDINGDGDTQDLGLIAPAWSTSTSFIEAEWGFDANCDGDLLDIFPSVDEARACPDTLTGTQCDCTIDGEDEYCPPCAPDCQRFSCSGTDLPDYHRRQVRDGFVTRPTKIFFNGTDETDADAWIEFLWAIPGKFKDDPDTPASVKDRIDGNNNYFTRDRRPFAGVLLRADVFRPDRDNRVSNPPVLTQSVSYWYVVDSSGWDDLADEWVYDYSVYGWPHPDTYGGSTDSPMLLEGHGDPVNGSDLGTGGDMVMVVKAEIQNSGGSTPDYHKSVTQYRYHDRQIVRTYNPAGGFWDETFSGGERTIDSATDLKVNGWVSQLKMLVGAQPIEHVAQRVNEHSSAYTVNHGTVFEIAKTWLNKSDSESTITVGSSETLSMGDLADKLISYDTVYESGIIDAQYIRGGCGCGAGSPGEIVRHGMEFRTWTDGSVRGMSLIETEETVVGTWGGGNDTELRTTEYDAIRVGSSFEAPTRIVNRAVRDPSTGIWNVHRSEYDATTELLVATAEPSTTDDYDAWADGNVPPVWSSLVSGGLAEFYVYDSDNRHIGTWVGDEIPASLSPTAAPSGSVQTYEATWRLISGSSANAEFPEISQPESTSQVDAALPDGVGEVSHDTGFSAALAEDTGHARYITYLLTSRERATAAQNGPSSNPQYKDDTVRFFDDSGNNVWTRHPDGSMTYRVFDPYHNQVLRATRLSAEPTAAPGAGIDSETWEDFDPTDYNMTAITWNLLDTPTSASPEYHTTVNTYDDRGRLQSTTTHGGVTTYHRHELLANSERPGILYKTRLTLPYKLVGTASARFRGPVTKSWLDASGGSIRQSSYEVSGYTLAASGVTFTGEVEVARSVSEHTLHGLLTDRHEWHDVSDSSAYYTTQYEYDALGRTSKITAPNGTVTENDYDAFGRMLETRRGVGINVVTVAQHAYDGAAIGGQVSGNGLLTTSRAHVDGSTTRDTLYFYDHRGRRIATKNPLAPHSASVYDNLGRVIESAIYDENSFTSNIEPATQVGATLASGLHATGRRQYTDRAYSKEGRVWRTRTSLDPGSGTPFSSALVSQSWVDEMGRVLASAGPNGRIRETEYDWMGRAVESYTLADVPTDYADASGSSGDTVLMRVSQSYDSDYNLSGTTTYQRPHGMSGTAALTSSNSIASYTLYAYDDADRQIATVSYGTNLADDIFDAGGTAPTLPSEFTITNGLDVYDDADDESLEDAINALLNHASDPLATITRHNARGLVEDVIRPRGTSALTNLDDKIEVTRTVYDDLSRRIAVIENATDTDASDIGWEAASSPEPARWVVRAASADDDKDRVTSFVYDEAGNTVIRTAHLGSASSGHDDAQSTEYVFGTSTTGGHASGIETNDLLSEVRYPDETSGAPGSGADYTVTHAYNRLGELIKRTDQNGTEHSYTHDALGRVVNDDITSFTTGVIDGAVLGLEMTYNGYGLLTSAASYDDESGGSPTLVNEITQTFDDLLRLQTIAQDNDGDSTDDGVIVYHYDDSGTDNHSRMDGITYPSDYDSMETPENQDYTVGYGYGSSGDIDYKVSRIAEIREGDPSTGTVITEYAYAGGGMPVIVDYPVIDVELARDLEYADDAGISGTDTLGVPDDTDDNGYPALDRHGRVKRHTWLSYSGAAGDSSSRTLADAGLDLHYGYDRRGNRDLALDRRFGSHLDDKDQWYAYDGLNRLIEGYVGEHDATSATVNTPGSREWTLDPLGNWDRLDIDTDGDGDFGTTSSDTLDREDRDHNEANELADITPREWTGTLMSTGTPEYYEHDDAGNMTKAETNLAGVTGWTYMYDGWNRLVKVEKYYNSADYTVGEYEYDAMNRRIVRRADGTESTPDGIDQERTYYWSPSWQLLEEQIDTDDNETDEPPTNPGLPDGTINRIGQQIWGVRYIDDAVMRRVDRDATGSSWDRYYYLTDAQFSVRALLREASGTGYVAERVDYTPYGVAKHRNVADNTDGTDDLPDRLLDLSDYTWWVTAFNAESSNNADLATPFGTWGTTEDGGQFAKAWDPDLADGLGTAPAGWVSNPNQAHVGPDNSFGYCGYQFDFESGLYSQRYRAYSPKAGRWLQRDPLDYVEGQSLYQYTKSGPVTKGDPHGLWTVSRNNHSRAIATAQEGDTLFGLALYLGLDPNQISSWLSDYPSGNPVSVLGNTVVSCDVKYYIPNTIFFHADAFSWLFGGHNLRLRHYNIILGLGYRVVDLSGVTESRLLGIWETLSSDRKLYGFYLDAHSDGIGWYGNGTGDSLNRVTFQRMFAKLDYQLGVGYGAICNGDACLGPGSGSRGARDLLSPAPRSWFYGNMVVFGTFVPPFNDETEILRNDWRDP